MSCNDQSATSPGLRHRPYKRGYVACLGCRSRKVRCVLDSKPPCAKCRREHRECVFQTDKKAGKHREVPWWARRESNPQDGLVEEDRDRSNGQPSSDHCHQVSSGTVRGVQSSTSPQYTQHLQSSDRNDDPSLTDRVISTILTRPSDALDVLFDAARPGQPVSVESSSSPQTRDHGVSTRSSRGGSSNAVSESGLVPVSCLSRPSDDVLDLWDKCRFVRQGWFTAQEAVTYLDLFYQHLAPLSPVVTDHYANHKNHDRLIIEEPMLCCTLLMISSRFFILPGAGGVSRSHFIHHRLWQYCELLIRRIMFGQEKYSTAKTRIVGSIEALVLISDWHPRSVHLPPETEGWDGELISPAYDRRNRLQTEGDAPFIRWREEVFEPAKRSERMSWMLLGAAVNLAYELGIFAESTQSEPNGTDFQSVREYRAKRLLHIYVTQMGVKMGCSTLLPERSLFTASTVREDTQLESYMGLWMGLTSLMKTASAMFFQSMAYTKHQLSSGNYSTLLQHFSPSLVKWGEDFASVSSSIPGALGSLILIEYHYLKTYTSALAIQAVVERAISRGINRVGNSNDNSLETCFLPTDYQFIRGVTLDSCKVLEIATSMASEGRLRYAPLRSLTCITSSSVFLLKAASLGVRHADLDSSLSTLEQCIAALRASGTDDMDFSMRYATLIEKHVARFRANFIAPPISNPALVSDPPAASLEAHGDQVGASYMPFNHGQDSLQYRTNSVHSGGAGHASSSVLDPTQMPGNEWWALPFDPEIAPFHFNGEAVPLGLEPDSLNFLWNLPHAGEVNRE